MKANAIKVRQIRKELGLSQAELAKATLLSRSTIQKMEQGQDVTHFTIRFFTELVNEKFKTNIDINEIIN